MGKTHAIDTNNNSGLAYKNLILGIESSCDETAVAIVCRDQHGRPEILANIVLSQIEEHREFGGVVPEIAARAHLSALDHLIEQALAKAQVSLSDLNAIAVTGGPGLIGGLLVGLMSAKGLAMACGLPLICVNHLEGHALTARLTHGVDFPYLLLLVSGGHTQILTVHGLGQYQRLASTIDDALGEAFDKTAKLLSLGFPGGPMVEKAALAGDEHKYKFPHPLKGKETLNMSFSGLKTAVRNLSQDLQPLSDQQIADICASFQKAVGNVIVDRLSRAMGPFESKNGAENRNLIVAGGVAANLYLRQLITDLCEANGWNMIAPPLNLCGDNATMIAWAGLERFEAGDISSMDFAPRSRWPLDEISTTLIGSGKRGAKA